MVPGLRAGCGVGAAAAAAAVLAAPWPARRLRGFAASEGLAEATANLLRVRGAPLGAPELYARRWEELAPPRWGAVPLRVAQFNVLADGLSGMREDRGGFTESPPGSLDWGYRCTRLLEELLRHGTLPEVIALEEVDHFHDWFEPVLSELGYEGSFLAKPNSPCRHSLNSSLADGCALFWRRDSVSLVQLETLNYDSIGGDGLPTGGKDNQVAIMARLHPRGAAPLVVAVTHLAAKKTPSGERQRAQQLAQLLDRVQASGLPCVVAGDLNAAPESGTAADYPSEAYPLALQHPLGLRSVYAEALGGEPAYTTWKRRGAHEVVHTIDYLLVSGPVRVLRVLAPPAPEEVESSRLPGWRYPSDHVALLAELELPPAAAARL